jgi:cytochrome c oxidase subunit 2
MNELMRRLLSLPEQASSFAKDVDHLHYFVIGTTMVGWAVATVILFAFLIIFRRRSEGQKTRRIRASLLFETMVIGGLLTLFIVWWLIGFDQFMGLRSPPKDALEVYVTAKQWMWKFAHPDGRESLGILTVPTGRPVKLLLTSRDVIHSFSVPSFRVKQDAVPGRYTSLWFEAVKPGSYQVLCAEYCGLQHSKMWGSVVALSPRDYELWLAESIPGGAVSRMAPPPPQGREIGEPGLRALAHEAPPPLTPMVEMGRDVGIRYGCFGCHTVDGRAHIGPTWLGLYRSRVLLSDGRHVLADEAYLTESMMDPLAKVVQGFNPVMPTFQGLLSAPEAAALVEFIKSLSDGRGMAPKRLPRPKKFPPTEFMKRPTKPRQVPPFSPPFTPRGNGSE